MVHESEQEVRCRWSARGAHREACTECGFADYTPRDARHSCAVRAIRSGVPAEVVARQLGHANAVLVHKVYGRFAPDQDKRDKWERMLPSVLPTPSIGLIGMRERATTRSLLVER